MDFDTTVKLCIYQTIADTTKLPTADDVANILGASRHDVVQAFHRLHRKRLLVPEPMRLELRDQTPVPQPCAIHFAVPAARWWDDIVYT
jgi:DNA-binding transcriptional MocR family regulator